MENSRPLRMANTTANMHQYIRGKKEDFLWSFTSFSFFIRGEVSAGSFSATGQDAPGGTAKPPAGFDYQ